MRPRQPRATRTYTLFPHTTLFRYHAQLYYTEMVLVKNEEIKNPEEFHAAVFQEYHQRGNRLASEAAIQALFERLGVGAEEFQSAWKSFEVRSEEHTSELQSLMRISYAVFCLKKKTRQLTIQP